MFELGREVSLDHLINGKTGLEAEVVFWLDKDLPGPTVTREDVIEASAEVAGAIELIAPRVAAYDNESLAVPAGGEQPISDWPNRHNHGIIDNVWHIGVIFGSNRVGVDEVDFMNERVSLAVNDETIVEGRFYFLPARGRGIDITPCAEFAVVAGRRPLWHIHRRIGWHFFVGLATSAQIHKALAADHPTSLPHAREQIARDQYTRPIVALGDPHTGVFGGQAPLDQVGGAFDSPHDPLDSGLVHEK